MKRANPEIAALMRSVAKGESAHAFGHLDFIRQGGIEDPATNKPIRTLEEMLQSAIEGEDLRVDSDVPRLRQGS
jgi:rubrerythrin